jgi:serine/threonine-protein kinase
VDSEQRIQLVGMALLRGLLDESTLRRALASGGELVEALQAQGSLDEDDLRDLGRLLQAGAPAPSPAAWESDPITSPHLLARGRGPWDSLPGPGEETDGTGRQVLRLLALPTWKHYRNLRFVAEGGMGRVFKAFDSSLKRVVALKFLRQDDPELVRRFVLEAQNQAKVDHPNICKVFEVGEWQGQSYIAMQFIKGETLEAAATGMNLVDKAKVMEAVAEAVHAAHRQGLIHRDLKPANIMVEPGERGPKPTILDFGLARGLESTGMTMQGMIIGTVHYMAPEQARGEHQAVGRRTDVYGLGATLHRVLTGQPPFAGTEGLEVVRRTMDEDLPSLTRLVPDLPQDLDTIVRKCLEKDPARRYESALAVAEDLRRWREGEPILARRPTTLYLLTKWGRRNRLVVVVAALALVGLLATGGAAIRSSALARAQARHAQHFGQEAERIEALLRYAHLLPPHDVGPELAQARARMATLEAEARRVGRLAEGPAAYALGRSHLALGDAEKAKALLDEAWSGGLRTPEVALALGRALAATYELALDQAKALPSRELREARVKELVRSLRDPALARLREGAPAALEAPAYHEALVAFMGERWEEAQAKAREAILATPWLFEAKRLEGLVLLARARNSQRPEDAIAFLSEAEAAFREARRLGPSDPESARGELRALTERASQELGSGRKVSGTLNLCREALARMSVLRPEDGEAPACLARVLAKQSELLPLADPRAQSARKEAQELSGRSMILEPSNPVVIAMRVPLLLVLGSAGRRNHGTDPLPWFQEALELARRGRQLRPQDPVFSALVAIACMRKMTWEMNTGTPPWMSFEEGLVQARALRDRFPELPSTYKSLATLWVERAEFERIHGLDPRPSVAAALEAVHAAEARGLRLSNPGWSLGDAYLIQGQYLLAVQGSGEAEFLKAAEAYRMAFRANPNLYPAFGGVAEALLGCAQGRLERQGDPQALLAEAKVNLDQMGQRDLNPDHLDYLRGQFFLLSGRYRALSGADPQADWGKAESAFRKAAARSGIAKAFVGMAEIRARAYLREGKAGDRNLAMAAAQEALRRDGLRAEAWFWIAVVEKEAARRGDPGAASRAREGWRKALNLDGNLARWAKELGYP